MLNKIFKKVLSISLLFTLIASVILPGAVMLSPPFVAVNAVDPDWTVTITITQGANFETVMFADHMDDLNSGNWISLSGGTAISLPYLKGEYAGVDNVQYTKDGKEIDISSLFTSKTVVYPLNTHPVYLSGATITADFKGDTDFAGLPVDFRLIRCTTSDLTNAFNDTLKGDLTGLKSLIQDPGNLIEPAVLDAGGDAQVFFAAPAAGDYVLVVLDELDPPPLYPGSYELRIFSATPVQVLDYALSVNKPNAVDKGESINVGFTMTAPPSPTTYRYGAVMIRESAYRVTARLQTDDFLANTDLFLNGVLVVEGVGTIQGGGGVNLVGFDLDALDTGVVTNKISQMFGASNIAIAFSNPTANPTGSVSLMTDSGMPTGTYMLLAGVWEQGTGKKLVAFTQSTVELSAVAPPSPPSPPANKNPIADAGPPITAMVGDSVSFDGSASNDADGTIASYTWDFGDGSTGSGVTTTHTYNVVGTYTVTLTVKDNLGATASDTTTATIKANQPPEAHAGSSRNIFVGHIVTFNGYLSNDPDGTIVSYVWDFGDGLSASGSLVQHTYSAKGTYTVTLTVTDNKDATDTASITIKVEELPMPAKAEKATQITGAQKNVVIDAVSTIGVKIKINTTSDVVVYLIQYQSNPHPEVPLPPNSPGIYFDVSVSDPDAVTWPIYVEVHYTDEEVVGLDESTFVLFYFAGGSWHVCSNTGVDTVNNIVWAWLTRAEVVGSPLAIGRIPTAAQFTLSNLSVSPAHVGVGSTVTVQVAVNNVGELEGSTTVDLLVNGVKEQTKTVTLAGVASTTVSFTVTKTTVGSYTVKVGDLTVSFTVVKPPAPAAFTFTDLVVSPAEVKPGGEVTVSVTVKNIGELSGTYSAELKIDGLTKETKTGTLTGGASTTLTFKVSSQDQRIHVLQIGDATVSFTVTAPPPTPPDYTIWIVAVMAFVIVAAVIWYTRMRATWKSVRNKPSPAGGVGDGLAVNYPPLKRWACSSQAAVSTLKAEIAY